MTVHIVRVALPIGGGISTTKILGVYDTFQKALDKVSKLEANQPYATIDTFDIQ